MTIADITTATISGIGVIMDTAITTGAAIDATITTIAATITGTTCTGRES